MTNPHDFEGNKRIGYTRVDKKIKGSHNGGIYGRDKKATEKNFHGRVQETDGGFIQRGKAKGGNRKGIRPDGKRIGQMDQPNQQDRFDERKGQQERFGERADKTAERKQEAFAGERNPKKSGANLRDKVEFINARSCDFGRLALCRALKVNRSTTYYRPDGKKKLAEAARHEKDLQDVKEAFEEGKENYGARQIKTSLAGKGVVMSRRKISRLMKELGLLSAYGIPKYTKPDTKSAGQTKLTFRICSAEISVQTGVWNFVRKREFPGLENLRLLFGDWVHWYNNIRFHSANGNKSPVTYRLENTMAPLKKVA